MLSLRELQKQRRERQRQWKSAPQPPPFRLLNRPQPVGQEEEQPVPEDPRQYRLPFLA